MRPIQTMKHEKVKFVMRPGEILLNQMVFSLKLLEIDSETLVNDEKYINLFEDPAYLQEY